jgi:hypothetical protein
VTLESAGTKTTRIVRRDQPCALDLRARSGKKLESAEAIVNEVLARLATIFDPSLEAHTTAALLVWEELFLRLG